MKKSKLTVDSCGGKYFGKINKVSALDYMHPHEETEKQMLQCKSLEKSIWTNHVFKTKKRSYKKNNKSIRNAQHRVPAVQEIPAFHSVPQPSSCPLHVCPQVPTACDKSCKPLKDISKFGSVLYMYICMRPQNINLSN